MLSVEKINNLEQDNENLQALLMNLVIANEFLRKEFFRADRNKDMWREKAEKYRAALEQIQELNKSCSGCNGNSCGVCTNAEGKPNNSYRIANEVCKNENKL